MELTFKKLRIHKIALECVFIANWDIDMLNIIKKEVIEGTKKHHIARVQANKCLNNIEHKLSRAAKLLEALGNEPCLAQSEWENSLKQLVKIKRWYE